MVEPPLQSLVNKFQSPLALVTISKQLLYILQDPFVSHHFFGIEMRHVHNVTHVFFRAPRQALILTCLVPAGGGSPAVPAVLRLENAQLLDIHYTHGSPTHLLIYDCSIYIHIYMIFIYTYPSQVFQIPSE